MLYQSLCLVSSVAIDVNILTILEVASLDLESVF